MYPAARAARDRFILQHRGPRLANDPWQYQNLIVEDELTAQRIPARTATVFLTGHECAWRCVMCDLWQYTTATITPAGAIPAQIAAARTELARRQETIATIKLYNASNFFDPRAVPDVDYSAIVDGLRGLERVIVESHPALIGARVERLRELLERGPGMPDLEVAMGLETAHPDALERLNKGLTLTRFSTAADDLRRLGVALRVFLLIAPPFVLPHEQDRWLLTSIEAARSCGASAIALIPTRGGNGAMEALKKQGLYVSPDLDAIERSFDLALNEAAPARILVDLWDLRRFAACRHCLNARAARLQAMNLEQQRRPPVACTHCGHGVAG